MAAAPETSTWAAFQYPNYRRYWYASVALVFGLQFRFIAGGWLVFQLTDSPFWLGVPGIVSLVMTLAVMVPASALADRVDNQHLLAVGRGVTGLVNLGLGLLVVSGAIELWMVIVWAILTGALSGVTNPAQNALLPRLIDRKVMASAVALTSAIWNAMRIVGPACAGLLMATIGIGEAFLVTAGGYAISTFLIATLSLAPAERDDAAGNEGALAGIGYIVENRLFFAIMGLSFFSSVFGRSYVTLLPIFAGEIFDVGAIGLGAMEAAAGVGGLLGTLSIVRIATGRHTGLVMVGASIGFGLFVGGFSASGYLVLSMGLLFAAAVCGSIYLNLGMTTLQLMVPNHLRGRVMGVWGLTWFLAPAGGMVAALLAEWQGARFAVAFGGLAVAGFAAVVYVAFAELRGIPDRAEMRSDSAEPSAGPQSDSKARPA